MLCPRGLNVNAGMAIECNLVSGVVYWGWKEERRRWEGRKENAANELRRKGKGE